MLRFELPYNASPRQRRAFLVGISRDLEFFTVNPRRRYMARLAGREELEALTVHRGETPVRRGLIVCWRSPDDKIRRRVWRLPKRKFLTIDERKLTEDLAHEMFHEPTPTFQDAIRLESDGWLEAVTPEGCA